VPPMPPVLFVLSVLSVPPGLSDFLWGSELLNPYYERIVNTSLCGRSQSRLVREPTTHGGSSSLVLAAKQ
jgi:hypothetical protein